MATQPPDTADATAQTAPLPPFQTYSSNRHSRRNSRFFENGEESSPSPSRGNRPRKDNRFFDPPPEDRVASPTSTQGRARRSSTFFDGVAEEEPRPASITPTSSPPTPPAGNTFFDRDLEAGTRQNGDVDEKDDDANRPRLTFGQRCVRITWAWFPMTMSTGAMASLLSQQPYTFPGILVIGKMFYIVDVIFFCIFFSLILVRFSLKPRAFPTSLHHPSESFFFGGFWVSIALIIYGAQVYGVPSCGPWLVHTLRVVFWVYFTSATLVAIFQYHVIFHLEKMTVADAMPAWILPAYPFLVTGVLAAAISKTQPEKAATQLIIGGIAGQGLGWILAFFIYTVYLTRLINSAMPPAPVRPGMYVSVGPAAYTCAGILSLGRQARIHIAPDFLGITSFPVGDMWFALSVPVALFLWLIAVWFSALSTLSVIRGVPRMHFTVQWWAFVFPNAGLAIATIQIGQALNSRGIKLVGTVITLILVPLWIMCAILHVRKVWTYELLAPGKDMGVEDVNEMHDLKQEQHDERKRERREKRDAKKGSGAASRSATWRNIRSPKSMSRNGVHRSGPNDVRNGSKNESREGTKEERGRHMKANDKEFDEKKAV